MSTICPTISLKEKSQTQYEKKDFKQYVIEKYQSQKRMFSTSIEFNSQNSPSMRMQTDRSHNKQSRNRNSSENSKQPFISEETPRWLNFQEQQIMQKKQNGDGQSKNIDYSLFYDGHSDAYSKMGFKMNRLNDCLNKLVDFPKIQQKDQFSKTQNHSSYNTSPRRKDSINSINLYGTVRSNQSIFCDYKQNKKNVIEQKTVEGNLQNVLEKQLLKEMQLEQLKKDNFYDRIQNFPINVEDCKKIQRRQLSLEKSKTGKNFYRQNISIRQKIPQLNSNIRSHSNDSKLSFVLENQGFQDSQGISHKQKNHEQQFIGKQNKEELNKAQTQKYSLNGDDNIEINNEQLTHSHSINNDDQYLGKNIFNSSIDEIKTREFDFDEDQHIYSNDQKLITNYSSNESKVFGENSQINNSLDQFNTQYQHSQNEEDKINEESYNQDQTNEESNYQEYRKNVPSIPYQRQWVISSRLQRQSPYFSHRITDYNKPNFKLYNFNFSKDDKKLNLMSQNENIFERNPYFDIHFQQILQHKYSKNGQPEQSENQAGIQQQCNDLENLKKLRSTSQNDDFARYRLKRKTSIFHQENVVVLNKKSLQQTLTTTPSSRNISSQHFHKRIKGLKTEENENKRYIKPYKTFVRNKDQSQEEQKNGIKVDIKNLGTPNKIYSIIGEKSNLFSEENHTFNEQLIEGLQHNIDRFLQSLKDKIQNNKKLDSDIKQECYIFDFDLFINNMRYFILSSILKQYESRNENQSIFSITKNSIQTEGITLAFQASFKQSLLGTPKYDMRELISQLLNTKFGFKTQNDELASQSSQKGGSFRKKNSTQLKTVSDRDGSSFSSFRTDSMQMIQISNSFISPKQYGIKNQVPIISSLTPDKQEPLSFMKRKNSVTITSPRVSSMKAQIKQNSQFSRQKSNMSESNPLNDFQNARSSIKNITNVSISDQHTQSQFASPILTQRQSIRTLKSFKEDSFEKETPSKSNLKGKPQEFFFDEQADEQAREKAFLIQKQIENRKKEEDMFQQYMQFFMNEIDHYSKDNMRITPSVFDQLLTVIMEILLEFQYSNLSINQYMSQFQNNADIIVENTIKNELSKASYDKLVNTSVQKLELQSKMSSSLTKFLHAVFDVEEGVILKRFVHDASVNNPRSQQLLNTINETASHCSLNYLQFYSLKLYLYEILKEVQANFKTIQKVLSSIEAYRNEICKNKNTIQIQSDQQTLSNQGQIQYQIEIIKDEEEIKQEQLRKDDEYEFDLSNKSSLRKLIDEFEWMLQSEMVEFMQSDSKLHQELQLFITDLVFCLARIYPQEQILLHKDLDILTKSFYDQIIFYFCQLLFQKKMPMEVIRNIFVSSYQLSSVLEFEQKFMILIGGFNPILALSFILSSVNYMDKYRLKCVLSSEVTLINSAKNLDNSELEDNTSSQSNEKNIKLIILTIQNFQMSWLEFLLVSYFSSSPCFNIYDLKAALILSKIDKLNLQKLSEYLQKLSKYFNQKCLQKFGQELQISMSFLK